MAQAVAVKLVHDPSLVRQAQERLQRWKAQRESWPTALDEWESILATSDVAEVVAILLDESEEGCRRRQSSPFTGVLSEPERRKIFAAYETIGA